MSSGDIVGILVYPLVADLGLPENPRRTPRGAYRRALATKANPRSPDYMRQLFAERYPEGRVESSLPTRRVDQIVLLYPDAIGLGFRGIERELPSGISVRVLNGRRREFIFDRRTRCALTVRRTLERTMVAEALGLLVFAAVTPILLLIDLVRGRR